MKKLNKVNAGKRDMILFREPYHEKKYLGGIRPFENLSYHNCEELINLDAIDPDDRQNEAPPVKTIMEFLKAHPNFTAHGYAVSPYRDDYRVSIEGVECGPGYSMQDVLDFFNVFNYPDEFQADETGLWCWFD